MNALLRTMSLAAVALAVSALMSGCAPAPSSSGPPLAGDATASDGATAHLTADELRAARAVLERHLAALGDGDTAEILRTVTEYEQYIYKQSSWPEQVRKWRHLQVRSISFPGKYGSADEIARSYRDSFGRDPYRIARFHVVAERPLAQGDERLIDLDFTLVRETPADDWLVGGSGR